MWTTIKINRHLDNPSICDGTATYTSGAYSFTFSLTVSYDAAGQAAYVAAAKAALAADQAKKAEEAIVENGVLADLNA